ncbi:MAG: hypothetical protein DCF19_14620 [Pseudanabaena frigida]|uniref:Uncharacterized protein n=1 Tax=Pseudanabaena frigida TaxID=945775 RepID=A0A2W4W3M6_9CYAN|nr:MAG: hypothetical protein DCF19_14620 [Pseudanabaena frigida]
MISSTFFLDTAWAGNNKCSYPSGNVSVRGYVKKDGSRVKPYVRTTSNTTKKDNWSTIGNTNPYTGKKGTKRP